MNNSHSVPPSSSRPRGVSTRVVWVAMAVLSVAALAVLAYRFLAPHDGAVELMPPPTESTATVSFAGEFPSEGQAPLRNPLGIAIHEGRLYVAEADAGRVLVMGLDGRRIDSFDLPRSSTAAVSYPVDVAYVESRGVLVVDTAGSTVLVLDPESPEGVAEPFESITVPTLGQPTAIAAGEEEVFVADASDRTIRVFSVDGKLVREMQPQVQPEIGFIGGMALANGVLYLTDSNSGRLVAVDSRSGLPKSGVLSGFALPRGVDARSDGTAFVADTFAGTVQAFDRDGEQRMLVGADETSLSQSTAPVKPADVAWSDAGFLRLYVSDAGIGKVRVYNVVPDE